MLVPRFWVQLFRVLPGIAVWVKMGRLRLNPSPTNIYRALVSARGKRHHVSIHVCERHPFNSALQVHLSTANSSLCPVKFLSHQVMLLGDWLFFLGKHRLNDHPYRDILESGDQEAHQFKRFLNRHKAQQSFLIQPTLDILAGQPSNCTYRDQEVRSLL